MLERMLGDRYLIEEMLARGGMATVWRGRDLRLDRPVAIKVLAAAEVPDPTASERFDREARIVAQLAHPNIVGVFDFGTDQGDPYLVMEFIEGRGVGAMLADGPLRLADVLAIGVQTCDGLSAAHAAGVIHRDIKPANLIVTTAGVVKICDFGIARLQHAAGLPYLTGAATAIGTSAYMAPEQAAGDPVDARTDLYALGCTIYAMLTGKPPFTGDSPQSVLQQHRTSPPAPLRMHRADIPSDLDSLVGDLLAKNPADRPTDAGQVKTRLVALSNASNGADAPLVALRAPGMALAKRPRRLGAAGMAIAVIAAVVLTAGSIALANIGSTGSAAWQAPAPLPTTGLIQPAEPPPIITALPATTAAPSTMPAQNIPASPTDPFADMRVAIQQQVQTGHLNPDAANDLHSKIDEIVRETAEGQIKEAVETVAKLRDKLVELHKGGKLSTAGYELLSAKVDLIADSLT
jgi:hypothetical protein